MKEYLGLKDHPHIRKKTYYKTLNDYGHMIK